VYLSVGPSCYREVEIACSCLSKSPYDRSYGRNYVSKFAFCVVALSALSGCCMQPVQSMRTEKLSDVISDLRGQLNEIKAQCKESTMGATKCSSGQILSEVDVTLAVTKVNETDIGVSLPVGPLTLSGTNKDTGTAANTILLKFSSPLFAANNTILADRLSKYCAVTQNASAHPELCGDPGNVLFELLELQKDRNLPSTLRDNK
jgi:hypothetical protein